MANANAHHSNTTSASAQAKASANPPAKAPATAPADAVDAVVAQEALAKDAGAREAAANPVKLTGEELARMEKAAAKQDVVARVPEGPLQTEQGDTSIEDRVVEKIAEIAAREIPGVYAMGTSTQRTISNIAGKISRAPAAGPSGVSVKTGLVQASIELTIVVEYGFSIVEVADGIRANIIDRVGQMTGLDVIEVNIDVSDVHLPSDDDQEVGHDSATQLR